MTSSCRTSNLWNVSDRHDGDLHDQVLAEEDDWFATPFHEQPADTDEVAWQDDVAPGPPPRRYAPDGLAQRQVVVVLAVVAIVAVVAIGILVVRAFSGSGNTSATPPATVPTTPAATTKTTTTPSTSTTKTTPTTTTTPTTGTVTSVPTDATLKAGSSGSSVTALQKALTQLGYQPGTADGSFGAATTQAVVAFQAAKGLTQDGVAGATTLAAINTALAAG